MLGIFQCAKTTQNNNCIKMAKKRRRKRNKRRRKRNRKPKTMDNEEFVIFDHSTETTDDDDSAHSDMPRKKVRFASELCEVHLMIQWSFAYQQARKGPWEELARDRFRFQNRIRLCSDIIGRVLKSEHRQKIFNERFNSDFYCDNKFYD